MATVSIVCDLLDAMVTRFTAAVAPLGAPNTKAWVKVSDGPLFGDEAVLRKLEIGVDDPQSTRQGSSSAFSQIEWAALGNRARDELIVVNLSASARSGGTDSKVVRDSAYAIVRAVQLDLYAQPIIGGALYARVSEISLQQGQNKDGAVAEFMFAVEARVRLNL